MVCCCWLLGAMGKGYGAWERHHKSDVCMDWTMFGELMGQSLGKWCQKKKGAIGGQKKMGVGTGG